MTAVLPLIITLLVNLTACLGQTSKPWGPADMVEIPAGEFVMGSPQGQGLSDERPQRSVYLRAFLIDRYEVTNAQYERFVTATGHAVPTNPNPAITLWSNSHPVPGSESHPVVNVSWHDATGYCAWAGKRLPNESEWVQDWYEPSYYLRAPRENPQGPAGKLLKVVRGGSWLKPASSLRTTDRDYGFPDDHQSGTGFRCAKDVSER